MLGKVVALPSLLVHQRFEQRAFDAPDRTALVYEDTRWTYGELNERANRLAHYLRRQGSGVGEAVGICMGRTPELVLAVLGVLKSGACYVPIDATYPVDRIHKMVEDVPKMRLVLASRETRAQVDSKPVLALDEEWDSISGFPGSNPEAGAGEQDLAYIVFTSGSTGRPKAAAVAHRGWANLLHWFVDEFSISSADRCLLVSSFGFDITQRAMVMALVAGGELHLLPEKNFDRGFMVDALERNGITLINCSPSLFYPVTQGAATQPTEELPALRCVFLGGEPIAASRIQAWAGHHPHTAIVNVYGVAECSDVSTWYRLHDYPRYVASSVPLGTAIYNTAVHVVDEALAEVAPREVGEICLGGTGVGRGYINDADLTAKRFVEAPGYFETAGTIYRTGDLGKILPDGNLGYVGRVDNQVKIRGRRIELEDVEAAVRRCPGVRDAVVIKRVFGEGDERLVAFLVEDETAGNGQETSLGKRLRQELKRILPEWMVPNLFMPMAELPLNPNGKVDRKALSQMEIRLRPSGRS